MFPFERVVVVGLGLIGGSVAQALRGHAEVIGVDADGATCTRAAADGIAIATLDAALRDRAGETTLVVVATPVPVCASVFAALAALDTTALVTDVASVKAPIVAAARAAGLRFVGGHPMAGSEHSGYGAASDSLFSGARWALSLDASTDLADVLTLAEVVLAVGAGVVPVDPAEHDRAVALVSHLPHVYAAELAARAVADGGDLALGLAAGSFRDGTRVARSPAAFWAGVLRENATQIGPVLRSAASELAALADAAEHGDDAALQSFFDHGGSARRRYEDRTASGATLAVGTDANAERAALLDLGRRGGFVARIDRSVTPTVLHTRVPVESGALR